MQKLVPKVRRHRRGGFIILGLAASTLLAWIACGVISHMLAFGLAHHYHVFGPGADESGFLYAPDRPEHYLLYLFWIVAIPAVFFAPLWLPRFFGLVMSKLPASTASNQALSAKLDRLDAKLSGVPSDPLAGAPAEYVAGIKAFDDLLAKQGKPTISEQAAVLTQARAVATAGQGVSP
jgi:hypothetical protein